MIGLCCRGHTSGSSLCPSLVSHSNCAQKGGRGAHRLVRAISVPSSDGSVPDRLFRLRSLRASVGGEGRESVQGRCHTRGGERAGTYSWMQSLGCLRQVMKASWAVSGVAAAGKSRAKPASTRTNPRTRGAVVRALVWGARSIPQSGACENASRTCVRRTCGIGPRSDSVMRLSEARAVKREGE